MKQNINNTSEINPLIALVFLWGSGILILLILLLFFDHSRSSGNKMNHQKFAILADTVVNTRTNLTPINDAYVFISVNKKHFLTRFVAIGPRQISGDSLPANPAVKKINKIIRRQDRFRSGN